MTIKILRMNQDGILPIIRFEPGCHVIWIREDGRQYFLVSRMHYNIITEWGFSFVIGLNPINISDITYCRGRFPQDACCSILRVTFNSGELIYFSSFDEYKKSEYCMRY